MESLQNLPFSQLAAFCSLAVSAQIHTSFRYDTQLSVLVFSLCSRKSFFHTAQLLTHLVSGLCFEQRILFLLTPKKEITATYIYPEWKALSRPSLPSTSTDHHQNSIIHSHLQILNQTSLKDKVKVHYWK